jgi:WD40 repeat protein
VAFNPDGTRITRLGQAFDRTARIWDLTNGEELVGLETRANAAWSVEFSPDGRRIATAHWATAKVWDAATGMSLLTLRGHTDRVRGVAFSPDGKRLGTASMDRSVRVWDLTVLDEGHTHQLALDP